MKNIFKTILIFAAIAVIILAANFYWKYFRGVWPAILPPVSVAPGPSVSPSVYPLPSGASPQNTTGMPLVLPTEFSISIFAKGLGDPRVITRDPVGNLLVSIPAQGKVVALPDRNGDGVADQAITVISGLNNPHGLATRCTDVSQPTNCQLYIAESNQVAVYDYDGQNLKAINKKKIIDLPNDGEHFTRTIMFMPYQNQDKLLISVGSDCNACDEKGQNRAKILIANADGSDLKTYASGLRNSVFMTASYIDGRIWATEMGRDYLGDNLPPDEINIIQEGKNYGWPICYGKNIHDTNFDKNTYIRNPCAEPFETPSYIDIPAHSAPLGLAFVPEEGWPSKYWYNLFVAYHGSWNRNVPTGYKIVRMKIDEHGNYSGTEDFITGWLKPDDGAYGRPVDILVQSGGVMYISDDKAGVIYRVVYQGK